VQNFCVISKLAFPLSALGLQSILAFGKGLIPLERFLSEGALKPEYKVLVPPNGAALLGRAKLLAGRQWSKVTAFEGISCPGKGQLPHGDP
jgi:hypothetical protein